MQKTLKTLNLLLDCEQNLPLSTSANLLCTQTKPVMGA